MSESPVLKPGGFWVCPACGQRNKVWAPCSGCGTALAGMGSAAAPPAGGAAAASAAGATAIRPRRRWPAYALIALGVAAAVAVGVLLTRLLGGATLMSEEPAAAPAVRADARTPPPAPEPLPSTPPPTALPQDARPPTPPAAVYTPSTPVEPPGYSIPAPPSRPRPRVLEPRAGADLRARQQAVRAAQARFERAEAALAAAGGADPEAETSAMIELEEAARALREAEAALDRARRRAR